MNDPMHIFAIAVSRLPGRFHDFGKGNGEFRARTCCRDIYVSRLIRRFADAAGSTVSCSGGSPRDTT
jgi:hypothetical protein